MSCTPRTYPTCSAFVRAEHTITASPRDWAFNTARACFNLARPTLRRRDHGGRYRKRITAAQINKAARIARTRSDAARKAWETIRANRARLAQTLSAKQPVRLGRENSKAAAKA